MATAKKRASSRGATKAQDTLRRDALLLFRIVNDKNIPADVRHDLTSYVDEVVSDAPSSDWTNNQAHFLRCFMESARDGLTQPVSEVLERLDKGESILSIMRGFRGQLEATSEEDQTHWLTMPEPEDRASAEWRYWKLRRMEKALQGENGPQAQQSAQREFKQMAQRAVEAAIFEYHHAAQMLPHFITLLQEMEKRQKGGAR